ncbi:MULTISPECIES: hypothetical protein [Streptomyces]|uniref:hypothetical protein n=1 Tax=Streptomyces TaxID=1883 RepID=UPI00136C8848|nr:MULTISPECIES: hypothetical protein [Streptomyces]MYX87178.1 hypothetical protein [Streptomyces sp. SID4915]
MPPHVVPASAVAAEADANTPTQLNAAAIKLPTTGRYLLIRAFFRESKRLKVTGSRYRSNRKFRQIEIPQKRRLSANAHCYLIVRQAKDRLHLMSGITGRGRGSKVVSLPQPRPLMFLLETVTPTINSGGLHPSQMEWVDEQRDCASHGADSIPALPNPLGAFRQYGALPGQRMAGSGRSPPARQQPG